MRNDLTLFDDGDFNIFSPFDMFRFPEMKFDSKEFNSLMKTDIKECENGYCLDIEMPGVDKKDISIDLNEGYLKVSASTSQNNDEKDKNGNYIRRERRFGSMSRQYFVGKNIKEEDIHASLNNGLLSINFPKKKEEIEQHKKITIN